MLDYTVLWITTSVISIFVFLIIYGNKSNNDTAKGWGWGGVIVGAIIGYAGFGLCLNVKKELIPLPNYEIHKFKDRAVVVYQKDGKKFERVTTDIQTYSFITDSTKYFLELGFSSYGSETPGTDRIFLFVGDEKKQWSDKPTN